MQALSGSIAFRKRKELFFSRCVHPLVIVKEKISWQILGVILITGQGICLMASFSGVCACNFKSMKPKPYDGIVSLFVPTALEIPYTVGQYDFG